MRVGDLAVFGADRLDIALARLRRQQARDDADGAARIGDIDRLPAFVARMDLHRGMDAAGRRAADQERDVEAFALHLGCHMHHLVERGRDEAGEADDVDLLARAAVSQDLRRRHHDAEVDDLVIVAGEHDADDVLADVVDVALDGRHQDLAGGLALAVRRRSAASPLPCRAAARRPPASSRGPTSPPAAGTSCRRRRGRRRRSCRPSAGLR